MTMMATQEPTDPSILLNSHNNKADVITTTVHSSSSSSSSSNSDDFASTKLPSSSSMQPHLRSFGTNHIDNDQVESQTITTPSSSATNASTNNDTTASTTAGIHTTNTPSTPMSASRTPPRSSLANDPNLTPIASIKRPRANLMKSHSSHLNGNNNSASRSQHQPMLTSPTQTNTMTPTTTRYGSTAATATASINVVDDSTPLSPMHKIKPVLHRETVTAAVKATHSSSTTGSTTSPSATATNDTAIKDTVEEIFSPVIQFLHDHDQLHHGDDDNGKGSVSQPRVTNSTSEDLSIELDFDQGHHYNTEDEEVYTDDVEAEDDDASMSRPEQHDYSNEGEFNPWQFIASLPPYETVAPHRPPITLPPLVDNRNYILQKQSPRKTLVLDLDETLVHCSVTEPADKIVDFTFPVQFHGETYSVHVKCRPYLQEFLHEMCQHFEVVVFTASQKVYADALLNILDPGGKCIHHRLFRESCLAVEGNYLKDLNVLDRDLRRTVLVDNSPHAFGYQVSNGIPIESWFDCPNDRELIKLQRFLLSQVLPADDVRIPVRNKFQSHVLIATAPPFHP